MYLTMSHTYFLKAFIPLAHLHKQQVICLPIVILHFSAFSCFTLKKFSKKGENS